MAGIRLRRTYRDHTMLLRVDRRVGSVRFGKVRPDSRTGTTCTTRRWESARGKTELGAHLHREPAYPGRRVVPRHHAPDRLARARLGRSSGPPRVRRPIPPDGETAGSIHTNTPCHRTRSRSTRRSPGKPIQPGHDPPERPHPAIRPGDDGVAEPAGHCRVQRPSGVSQVDKKSPSIIQHDLVYRKSQDRQPTDFHQNEGFVPRK